MHPQTNMHAPQMTSVPLVTVPPQAATQPHREFQAAQPERMTMSLTPTTTPSQLEQGLDGDAERLRGGCGICDCIGKCCGCFWGCIAAALCCTCIC